MYYFFSRSLETHSFLLYLHLSFIIVGPNKIISDVIPHYLATKLPGYLAIADFAISATKPTIKLF